MQGHLVGAAPGHSAPAFVQHCQLPKQRLESPQEFTKALFLLIPWLLCGCASARLGESDPARRFDFKRDTFAFANQLTWEYGYNAKGQWTSRPRKPPPNYTLHCFIVAHSAAQFFDNARFDAQQPTADEATYRRLIRRVVSTSLRRPLGDSQKVVIPGYPDLRAFSQAHENSLKEECGGAWRGYVQRGNWRMVFPFSRHEQEEMSRQLLRHLQPGRPLVVHLARFPRLTINHAILLYGAKETDLGILFSAYDPNDPDHPATLAYDRGSRTFTMASNAYFPGGRVDVYEIYYSWRY